MKLRKCIAVLLGTTMLGMTALPSASALTHGPLVETWKPAEGYTAKTIFATKSTATENSLTVTLTTDRKATLRVDSMIRYHYGSGNVLYTDSETTGNVPGITSISKSCVLGGNYEIVQVSAYCKVNSSSRSSPWYDFDLR